VQFYDAKSNKIPKAHKNISNKKQENKRKLSVDIFFAGQSTHQIKFRIEHHTQVYTFFLVKSCARNFSHLCQKEFFNFHAKTRKRKKNWNKKIRKKF